MSNCEIELLLQQNGIVEVDLQRGGKGDTGERGEHGFGGALGKYGSFFDSSDQHALNTVDHYAVVIGTTAETNGVTIVDGSKITFEEGGTYSITYSIQFNNTEKNVVHDVDTWLVLNGTYLESTNSVTSVPASRGGNPGKIITTVDYLLTLEAGDYLQLFWHTGSTNVSINTIPDGSIPDSPSIIVTVKQVMYTQMGNGIESIVVTPDEGGNTITVNFTDGVTEPVSFSVANGTDGVSITSITKVDTIGLVDTYEIVYSTGSRSYFFVTNGADGYTPIKGVDYFDGYTPVKGVDYFDGAKGDKGDKGEDAIINGVNALSIAEGAGIDATQVGDTLTISAPDSHTHSNKTALDAVSGTNTGDQDLSGLVPKIYSTNMLLNGDFPNGTNNWSPSHSSLSVASNTMSITGLGTNAESWMSNTPSLQNGVIGNKYYFKLKARVTNSVCTRIRLRNFSLTPSDYDINTPVQNQWYPMSVVKTATGVNTLTMFIFHAYADSATQSGKVMEVQYVSAIDLTATFGAGNEPTADAMDKLLSQFPNAWFDGTKEIFGTDDVYRVVNNSYLPYTGATTDTDLGTKNLTTTGNITGNLRGGAEVTVANKNKYYPLIADAVGNIIAKRFTYYWNGSTYATDYSNGFGYAALQNNTGSSSNGFGYTALTNNTGSYSNGFGQSALYNNTGSSSSGFGYLALQNNTGSYSSGFGYLALQNNTGSYSSGFGPNALQNNTGANSNGFGYLALQNNTGSYSNGFGYYALRYNQKPNNTAIGHLAYQTFLDNTSGNKTTAYTNVDIATDRITITSHGFGATNAYVNIKYASTTGTAIGGLTVGSIYQIKIIDANTIGFNEGSRGVNITSPGTGDHTFTPQYAYTNTTCLGANTSPTADNQVVLGDTLVKTFRLGGTFRTITNSTDVGVVGEMCYDASYVYLCTATNTWKRIALSTW